MTDVTTCPNCGSENPSGFRFCGTCGRPLAPVAPFTADRRSVTVLFADLVGFSTMAEQMDTEEVHALITELFAKLSRVVERRDGRVEKFVGDAVLAVFGAPAAHEDDPRRAVESALEMLDVVSRSSSSTLRLRIGINSGPVVAARSEHGETGLFGDAVNVAARLQQVAEPDQILVSEAVWRRVRREFDGTPVGALKVKGRSQPVDAVRVLGAKPTAAPHHGPFVGRRDERALLELLWSSVERGNTHVVTIVGEPGVGKSRLLAELPPRDVAVDARVTCGPDRAFGPFIEVLEGVLGGRPADLDELDARVAALGIEAGAARGLASLLGLRAAATADATDEQQKRQLFGAVLAFLTQAAGQGPLHVVLDDVHWADPSSLDLLEFLLGRLGGIPLMLILARRPAPRGTEDRVGPRASHTTIQLEPLTDEESEELVRRFLAVDDIPEDLQRTVVDRAEGNPFFIEELLRSLLELGSLTCQGSRAFLESTTLDVPDTVQGTILARIDRLPAEDRLVLQHAAVLGRGFSTGLLETILGSPDVIQRLDALSGAQLVVPGDDDRWSFKHALIEEVVYESLLQKQRHQIHQRAAEALEPKASDDPALLASLARHYALADVGEKARQYAVLAGDLAAERMGYVEAKERYETALRLWGEGDPAGRRELLLKRGRSGLLGGDISGARTALIEAEAEFRAIGDLRNAGAALVSLGRVHYVSGEGDRAREVLEEAIRLLEPSGPSPELVRAYVALSSQEMVSGAIDASAARARRGLDLEGQLNLPGVRSQLLNTLGTCEVFAGDVGGLDRLREGLELAQRSGEPEALGRAFVNLPHCLSEAGQYREGVELCRRGREVLRRLGAPGFEWFVAGNEAYMLTELGRYEEAEPLSREAMASQRAVMEVPGLINAAGPLIIVLTRTGRYEEAGRVLAEVMPLARQVGGVEFLSWMLSEEAWLEDARGNPSAAARSIEDALALVLRTPSVAHLLHLVVGAATIAPEQARAILERLPSDLVHPAQESRILEARAILAGDAAQARTAADLYAKLELPYQEARSRLVAGDLDDARRLIERYGLGTGPLGTRLAALTVS